MKKFFWGLLLFSTFILSQNKITIPYYASPGIASSSGFNSDMDTLKNGINRMVDTLDIEYVRWDEFRDSTIALINIDTIDNKVIIDTAFISYADIDTISGLFIADTINADTIYSLQGYIKSLTSDSLRTGKAVIATCSTTTDNVTTSNITTGNITTAAIGTANITQNTVTGQSVTNDTVTNARITNLTTLSTTSMQGISNSGNVTSDNFTGDSLNITNGILTNRINGTYGNFTGLNSTACTTSTGVFTTINSTTISNSGTITSDSIYTNNGAIFQGNVSIGSTSLITEQSKNLLISGTSSAGLYLQDATTGNGNSNGTYHAVASGNYYLWNQNNYKLSFGTNNTERMIIANNGDIGFSIDPAFKLDVGGQTSSTAENVARIGNISGINNGLLINSNVDNTYTMSLASGQFAIGTPSPTHDLTVNGSFSATSSNVTNDTVTTAEITTGNITTVNSSTINNSGNITTSSSNSVNDTITGTLVVEADTSQEYTIRSNGSAYLYGSYNSGRVTRGLTIGETGSVYGLVSIRKDIEGDYSLPGLFGFHGFEDYSTINMTDAPNAYASLALSPTITGTQPYNHYAGAQIWMYYSSTDTVDNMQSVDIYPTINNGHAINNYGLRVRNPTGTGTVGTNYGLYIENQTKGDTDYSIYSAGGDVYYGGDVGYGVNPTNNTVSIFNKYYLFNNAQGKLGDDGIISGGSANGNMRLEYYPSLNFYLTAGNNTVLTANSSRNIGINTSTITHRLTVDGTFKATSSNVTNDTATTAEITTGNITTVNSTTISNSGTITSDSIYTSKLETPDISSTSTSVDIDKRLRQYDSKFIGGYSTVPLIETEKFITSVKFFGANVQAPLIDSLKDSILCTLFCTKRYYLSPTDTSEYLGEIEIFFPYLRRTATGDNDIVVLDSLPEDPYDIDSTKLFSYDYYVSNPFGNTIRLLGMSSSSGEEYYPFGLVKLDSLGLAPPYYMYKKNCYVFHLPYTTPNPVITHATHDFVILNSSMKYVFKRKM